MTRKEIEKWVDANQDKEFDTLEGGLGSGKKLSDFDRESVIKGIEVEFEHTNNIELACEIACDHLSEHSNYYDKLADFEKSLEEQGTGCEIYFMTKIYKLLNK